MRVIRVLVFVLTVLFNFISYGQNPVAQAPASDIKSDEKKLLKSARKEFDYGNYELAAEKYAQLLKLDSINPTYNFEQGQTFYSNFRQPLAIPYFERAIKFSKDTIGEVYYLLASAYHLAGQFDRAQKNYRVYQAMLNMHGTDLTQDEEIDLKNEISHKIEWCENGMLLYRSAPATKFTLNGKTNSFQITNAGKVVNSDYDDYCAVLSANDSLMYFTSRREETTGGLSDWDDKYFEDIYVSHLGKNGWEKSANIGSPINTKMHEAMISLSDDGKTICFYRGLKQGTFYFSTLKGNTWTKPEVLFQDAGMLSASSEASFFGYAVAGSELYVVSQQDTGKTGRDIYLSRKKPDGSWGPLTNIGAPINTPYDEDAPFITRDGNTMYFSSKGHNSMGGFDIFKSERQGDTWSMPVNLGVPFNTPGEDIYFITANKNDQAYYSSSSRAADGTKDMDIYRIDLCDDIPQILLAGATFGITKGLISVTEKESKQKVGDFNIEDNKYSIPLKHGVDYLFTLKVPTVFEPVSFDISAPQMCKVYNLYQEIEFPQSGKQLVVKNVFFDIGKETDPASYSGFLTKIDKSAEPLYSEIKVPVVPVILAKADSAKSTISATTTTAGTQSVSTSGTTTTATTAGTHPVSTSGTTTTASTAGTHSVSTSGTATTATSAGTHSVSTSGTTTTAGTAGTHSVSTSGATTPVTATSTTATTHSVSTTTTAGTHTITTSSSSTTASPVTTISVDNILFDYDKASMKGEFVANLDKVVEFLKSIKKAKIEIAGYTDSKGSDEYNLSLSKRRANAVAAYLQSKGISKDRIQAVGYGESKSIAPNENPDGSDNPEGRAKNRRTEIIVTQ